MQITAHAPVTFRDTRYEVDGHTFIVRDTRGAKFVRSHGYNFNFNRQTGMFVRWGTNLEDDPAFSPIGPEILDLEISVNGCPNGCRFCYKGNTAAPATNMTFQQFKQIVDKMPKTLTQIAFGITGVKTNPDFVKMMQYCRALGIVPNFTLSGIDLDDEMAERCAKLVGALAVSAYQQDKNVCYNTVQKFTGLGIDQTNIHLMVSDQTIDFVYEVLHDRMNDPRLAKMNAIVFLGVKPKGRAVKGYQPLPTAEYGKLVQYCMQHEIPFGFDSCSAPKFEAAVKEMELPDERRKQLLCCSESCESSIFSAYINVAGEYWHCSFAEREDGQECVSVLTAEDFLRDVWYHPAVVRFREKSLASSQENCRRCTVFAGINP